MNSRQWILLFLTATLIAALAGCNSGSTFNVQNPPPPPAAGLSIAFQPAPPSSVPINSATPITAVVTNDTTNGGAGSGVDWVLTCQSGPGTCGSLLPPHTNSGQPATYTPPPSLAGNAEAVNIQGFATADHSKNVLASINVTAFGNNFSGTYVLAAQGAETGAPYQFAGVIVLDGNGNITKGEQTVNFTDPSTSSFVSMSGPIIPTGSSYFLGPDGRGTITINPSNPSNDQSIVPQTFSLVFLSNSHALITATPTSAQTISASGTMDLQAASITQPSAGYAFVVQGTDSSGNGPTAIGGVLNIDFQTGNSNNISGTGSVADQSQGFQSGILVSQPKPFGSVGQPDQFGAVILTLNFPLFSTPLIQFTGYIVDGTHIQLIESDNGGIGAVAGLAIGQGSATGTFVDDTSFSGPYVYGVLGVDLASGAPDTFTSAGVISANGAGLLMNGYTDTAFQSLFSPTTGLPAQISGACNGNYSDGGGTGRVHAGIYGFASPNGPFRPIYIFYLTGNGNPALVLAATDTNLDFPFLGTGIAYPQSSTLTFSGNYGLNFTQQNGTEYDGTGVMNVTLPTFSGLADVGANAPGQGFTGTVSSQPCSGVAVGCFPGAFVNSPGPLPPFQGTNISNPNAPVAFTADFYMIDQNHGFFIENDLQAQSAPQVSLGFFETAVAPQTPPTAAVGKLSKRGLR